MFIPNLAMLCTTWARILYELISKKVENDAFISGTVTISHIRWIDSTYFEIYNRCDTKLWCSLNRIDYKRIFIGPLDYPTLYWLRYFLFCMSYLNWYVSVTHILHTSLFMKSIFEKNFWDFYFILLYLIIGSNW